VWEEGTLMHLIKDNQEKRVGRHSWRFGSVVVETARRGRAGASGYVVVLVADS
jgi:hypothetical protein